MNSGELASRRKKSKSGLIFHSMACYQEWLQKHNEQKHKTYGLVNNPKGINQYSKGKSVA
jgi:hypothetical protein